VLVHARMANYPWQRRGQVMLAIYILVSTNHISGTAEARIVKFCMQVECIKS